MSQVRKLADFLAQHGRHGDSTLVHMTPNEVHALRLMSGLAGGNLTTNPDTGLPEAFDLKWLLPIAAIAALALTGGAAAPVLASTAGGAGAAGLGAAGAAGATAAGTAAATAAPTALTAGLGAAAPAASTIAALPTAAAIPTAAEGIAAAQAAGGALAPAASTLATAAPTAAQAAEMAANVNSVAPYIANTTAMPETASWGSQALNWAAENPLPTMLGLNALGNAFTPEAPQQEEESSDPENEWRPGEGNVPFQVRGVRSFNPQQISPSGVEQNWISTTPAQPYVRKYAQGGPVTNWQQERMLNIRPYDTSIPTREESASAAKFRAFGRGQQKEQPLAPVAAPITAQPTRDPSWYVQGFPGANNPVPTATRMPAFPQGAPLNPQPQFQVQPLQRPTPQGYAMGGPVGIAQGMEIPPMADPAPMGVPRDAPVPQMGGGMGDQELIMMAAQAIKSPTPESQRVLEMFVQKFGPDALQRLAEMVNPPIPENMGRLLKGPGTGTSDSIPAVIDGSQPAALSTGEFVVPAKAVSKLGKGSTDAGAQKLQSMVDNVVKKPDIEDGGVINL